MTVYVDDVSFLLLPNVRLALKMFRRCTQIANYSNTRKLTVTHTPTPSRALHCVALFYIDLNMALAVNPKITLKKIIVFTSCRAQKCHLH